MTTGPGLRQAQSPAGATGATSPVVEQRALRARRDPGDESESGPTAEPIISVTKGQPTAEELAALTAVVLALQGGANKETARPAARAWARRAQLNLPPRPGAGSWRRSAR